MKLLFVYIHEYKLGYNLSSNYNFEESIIEHLPQIEVNLYCKKLDSINNILFNNNICDLKAIIGENGTGKTTLLKYISYNCNELYQPFNQFDFLIFEDENGKINIVSNIELITFNIIGIENFIFHNSKDTSFLLPYSDNTNIIYYSNSISNNEDLFSHNKFINLSTNYLITADKEKWLNSNPLKFTQISEITAFRSQEALRMVGFINEFRNNSLFIDIINLPQTIPLKFNQNAKIALKELLKNESQKLYHDLVIKWLNILVNPNDVKIVFYHHYLTYYIYNFIINGDNYIFKNNTNQQNLLFKFFEKIIELFSNNFNDYSLNSLIEYIDNEESNIDLTYQGYKVDITNTSLSIPLKSIKKLLPIISNLEVASLDSLVWNIKYQDISTFYEEYKLTLKITSYLDFSFPGLSAGQLSFLTIFSRFHSLIDESSITYTGQIKENIKSLIILIDEGDVNFHPKWQSEFLYWLNSLLPIIFKNLKIQIIISSHSPFITSDLPNENILFLKKEKNQNINIVTSNTKTFAANIHDLLSDSFYLENAHIGMVSRNVLIELLDYLIDDLHNDKFDIRASKLIIDMVGDNWIKSKLNEKYKTKFGL